ncbi:hypothetical protein EXIGLDRAFT_736279 [Exidia glandulosa HHB12029]|uniref:F-box domain-containing protein n=1 Tax=Exidia glandulosa HHB12029 TaxID=1314781 RepID=A0A165JHR4_EXIGL|nr:hypothetical protein EXIGLDRAFT_736279 [Exidia glandulosa HHB12029]
MSFSMLPLELVYHVLTHAVLCGLREGRVRWAANLLAISRSCYTVMRPVLFQRTVLMPEELEPMFDFLKYCQLNGRKESVLGDVRELHILEDRLTDEAAKVFVSALIPARLHTVRVPDSVFRALSDSPDFAPRSFDATFWWPSDILALPPRALQSVTHMIVRFPDISTPRFPWILDLSAADKISSILGLLPALSHFALHHCMDCGAIPRGKHFTDFYDETKYLDIFRAILSRKHVVKVVVRLIGLVAMGTNPDKISKLLRSLQDHRLYTVVSDFSDMTDDMGYYLFYEARMDFTVWDMPCRQVYVDNDPDGVNCREGPSGS